MPTLGLIAVVPLLVLAACGGADAPATDSAPTSAATDGGGDVEATAPPAGGGNGSTGGGSGEEFCLNTIEEVSAALEVDVTDAAGFENPGSGGGCVYSDAEQRTVYLIGVVDNEQAGAAFEGYRQLEGAEEISGIGDTALYAPLNEIPGVAFTKGGVTYNVFGPAMILELPISDDPAAIRSAIEELARQAADRA